MSGHCTQLFLQKPLILSGTELASGAPSGLKINLFVRKGSGVYQQMSGSLLVIVNCQKDLNFITFLSKTVTVEPQLELEAMAVSVSHPSRPFTLDSMLQINSARRKCVGIRHFFELNKGKLELVEVARCFGEGIYNLLRNRNKGFSNLRLHFTYCYPLHHERR